MEWFCFSPDEIDFERSAVPLSSVKQICVSGGECSFIDFEGELITVGAFVFKNSTEEMKSFIFKEE